MTQQCNSDERASVLPWREENCIVIVFVACKSNWVCIENQLPWNHATRMVEPHIKAQWWSTAPQITKSRVPVPNRWSMEVCPKCAWTENKVTVPSIDFDVDHHKFVEGYQVSKADKRQEHGCPLAEFSCFINKWMLNRSPARTVLPGATTGPNLMLFYICFISVSSNSQSIYPNPRWNDDCHPCTAHSQRILWSQRPKSCLQLI